MDIKIKLELIQKLMSKNVTENQTSLEHETATKVHNISIANVIENGLVELIFKIKSAIEWIDFEVENHKQKWFSGYRGINFENKIGELRNLIHILDGRIILLMNENKYE